MMFQEARLMPWLTCRENIALGLPKGEKPGQVDQLLKLTGLTEAAKLYPSELSGACSSARPWPGPWPYRPT